MRPFLIGLAVLLLAACASNPMPPVRAGGGSIIVGTLAPLGSFEHELAPQFTRAEVIAIRTDRAVQAGALDRASAAQVLRQLQAARVDLKAAIALEAQTKDREAGRRRAQPALQSIDQAAALLRGQR